MGEGTHGMKDSSEQLEREVTEIRGRMQPVIGELDRRRHRLMDWQALVRRRGATAARIGLVLAGVIVAGRTVRRLRSRSR